MAAWRYAFLARGEATLGASSSRAPLPLRALLRVPYAFLPARPKTHDDQPFTHYSPHTSPTHVEFAMLEWVSSIRNMRQRMLAALFEEHAPAHVGSALEPPRILRRASRNTGDGVLHAPGQVGHLSLPLCA
jgi:hypothetical protein